MTTSNYNKTYNQLKAKPAIWKKYLKHNAPKKRTTGANLKHCKRCGSSRGFIEKLYINLCRRCFRQYAKKIGFKKYS